MVYHLYKSSGRVIFMDIDNYIISMDAPWILFHLKVITTSNGDEFSQRRHKILDETRTFRNEHLQKVN